MDKKTNQSIKAENERVTWISEKCRQGFIPDGILIIRFKPDPNNKSSKTNTSQLT